MILANVFYVMAIIVMTLVLILLIALVVAVFYIKNKITDIHTEIIERIDSVMRPAETVMDIGSTIAASAMDKIRGISKKHSPSNRK